MVDWKGSPIMKVVETDLRRPVDIFSVGVHEEVELGTVSCEIPRGEVIVTTPLHPDERLTRIQTDRF